MSAESTEPTLDGDVSPDDIVLRMAQEAVESGQNAAPKMPPSARSALWRRVRGGVNADAEEPEPEEPWLPADQPEEVIDDFATNSLRWAGI